MRAEQWAPILVGKRWGLFVPPHPLSVPEVKAFDTEAARDAWVAANPSMRSAVGKRHRAVKAYRATLSARYGRPV